MKDHRSVVQLKCWLSAVNIPCIIVGPTTLEVTREDGVKVPLHVVLKGEPEPPVGELRIRSEWIAGRNLRTSLAFFGALQEALGYTPKSPVDRGPIPTHKLSNGEDFDLMIFRHTELRRVPNPDPAKFKAYRPIVTRTVNKFLRDNYVLCQDSMLTADDLTSYALIWTTVFCGLDEMERVPPEENFKLLSTHLIQKFSWFRKTLHDRSRNILTALDDAHIGQHGRPYEHGNKRTWETQSIQDVDEDSLIVRRRQEWRRGKAFEIDITIGDPLKRRANATSVLDNLLGALDHDRFVQSLKDVAESNRVSPDAAGEARRRLEAHVEECSSCATLLDTVESADKRSFSEHLELGRRIGHYRRSVAKVDKDMGRSDPLGAKEKVVDGV